MKWIKLLLFSAFCLSIPQVCKKDFKVPPIHADIPFNPNWEMPLTPEVMEILGQPFSYFAQGNQTTVFLSQDGKTVLKLFRYKTTQFPLLHMLKNCFKKKPKKSFQVKMDKTLSAAHLACNEGKELTQAIYCHLNLTENTLPPLTLHIGKKKIVLPLDRTRFILQRKVQGFKETLLSAKDNPEEIHQLLDSFASLLLSQFEKNIRNSDPNVGPNFGFYNGKAVEIDFGNFQKIEPNPERQKAELAGYLNRLETAIAKWAPEYTEYGKELRIKTLFAYHPME
ncbi:MAG: hypothetical protein K1X28_02775 [Parachlamydiales bacterium]|nr:hypothetical protein [Parachlamydiales bacterium]